MGSRIRAWGLRVVLPVVGAALILSGLVGGDDSANPGPWRLHVDGQPTGFVAVAALDSTVDGPAVEWVARAATRLDVGIPPTVADQELSRERAWKAARAIMVRAGLRERSEEVQPPELAMPEAWFGQSTGLAYLLAYLDSAPLSSTPGSLAAGRTIAATGRIMPPGMLLGIAYLEPKFAAAKEAGAEMFFVPANSYLQAREEGVEFKFGDGTRLLPSRSVVDVLIRLCTTGGSGELCDAVMAGALDPREINGDEGESLSTWFRRLMERSSTSR